MDDAGGGHGHTETPGWAPRQVQGGHSMHPPKKLPCWVQEGAGAPIPILSHAQPPPNMGCKYCAQQGLGSWRRGAGGDAAPSGHPSPMRAPHGKVPEREDAARAPPASSWQNYFLGLCLPALIIINFKLKSLKKTAQKTGSLPGSMSSLGRPCRSARAAAQSPGQPPALTLLLQPSSCHHVHVSVCPCVRVLGGGRGGTALSQSRRGRAAPGRLELPPAAEKC